MTVYNLPLQQFSSGISEQQVNVNIENVGYIFYFQNNVIENNLFLSVYGLNQSPIYFGSFRCVFGNYINQVDNGFPFLVFFIDNSNNGYTNITFNNLNNGIGLYVKSR